MSNSEGNARAWTAEARPGAQRTSRPVEAPRRVLVVEDEPETRSLIEEALSLEGFSVRGSDKAHGVLSLIRRARPEVLVLDLRLPGLSGVQLLPLLASDAPDLPVVVVSGARDLLARHASDLEQLGAIVLEKPFSIEDLLGGVRMALERQSSKASPSVPSEARTEPPAEAQ